MLSENSDQENQGDQLNIPSASFYKCVSQKTIEIHIFLLYNDFFAYYPFKWKKVRLPNTYPSPLITHLFLWA